MNNLRRRLKNLDALLSDDTGLVRHSPGWLAYWTERIDELVAGRNMGSRCKIPLEAIDALIADDEATISG